MIQSSVAVCWRDGQIEKRVSQPWLNDVHHVVPTSNQTLLVANTGLDQVLELDLDGNALRSWNVADQPTWERFDRSLDYRRVETTKPHRAHPNHLLAQEGRWWVTRYLQADALALDSLNSASLMSHPPNQSALATQHSQQPFAETLALQEQSIDGDSSSLPGPHDGVFCQGRWYFTTVDGRVVSYSEQALAKRALSQSEEP